MVWHRCVPRSSKRSRFIGVNFKIQMLQRTLIGAAIGLTFLNFWLNNHFENRLPRLRTAVRILPRAYREFQRQHNVNWDQVLRESLQDKPYAYTTKDRTMVRVISLTRAQEQRPYTSLALEKQNVPFKVFEAVDGLANFNDCDVKTYAGAKKRKRLNLTEGIGYETRLKLYHDAVSSSTIPVQLRASLHERLRFGCYMSHVSLWQELLREHLPFLIILEDDVVIARNFSAELHARLENLPSTWGLLYLNGCFQKIGKDFRYGLRLSHGGLCTFGYLISAKAAQFFVHQAALNSDQPVDHMMDGEVLHGRVLAFHSEPPLVSLVPHLKSTLAYR